MNKLTTGTIIRSGTIILASTLVAHGINYAFTIAMSRTLLPHEYAALVAIISLINIIGIPLQTATTVAAKYTPFILRGYKDYLNATLLLGIGIMGAWICLIPLFSSALTLPWQALLLMSPVVFLTPSLSMNMGILQGIRKLWVFSAIPTSGSVVKLGSGILLVSAGYATLGALGAIATTTALSWLVSTGYVLGKLRHDHNAEHPSSHIPEQWKSSAGLILVSSIAIALMGNMDILAAKHFFTSHLAAQYSVLAVITRAISYGSLIMIPIVFPAMSQAIHPSGARALLKKGLIIASSIAGIILILFGLYPEQIIQLLPGSQYKAVTPYLLVGGISTALWSLSQLFLSYFIATDKKEFLGFLIGITMLQGIGIAIFHGSIWQILSITTAAQALLVCILAILAILKERHRE